MKQGLLKLGVLLGSVCVLLTVSGCMNMAGIANAKTELKCSADVEGLPCTPLSQVYKATQTGQLPGQLSANPVYKTESAPVAIADATTGTNGQRVRERAVLDSGVPVRTAPRVLRVWIAPWEDASGVLNDQRLVYLTLDSGRWLLEHNQRAIQQQYAPTRLVQGGTTGSAGSGSTATPAVSDRTQGGVAPRPAVNTMDQLGIRGMGTPATPLGK